jgi:hypothetical protein
MAGLDEPTADLDVRLDAKSGAKADIAGLPLRAMNGSRGFSQLPNKKPSERLVRLNMKAFIPSKQNARLPSDDRRAEAVAFSQSAICAPKLNSRA